VLMPVQPQQSLCMLCCFNLQLGVHCRRPRVTRTCTGCTAGSVEDEQHLLYGCSAYAELRQRYGVCTDQARRFQMHTVQATARFMRHAMRLRGERIEEQVPAAPVAQPGVGGNIGVLHQCAPQGCSRLSALPHWMPSPACEHRQVAGAQAGQGAAEVYQVCWGV
jgi:hypothetical protein